MIIPEIDGPAHTNSWARNKLYSDIVICQNISCPAPPCGQLDLSKDNTYLLLSSIFK